METLHVQEAKRNNKGKNGDISRSMEKQFWDIDGDISRTWRNNWDKDGDISRTWRNNWDKDGDISRTWRNNWDKDREISRTWRKNVEIKMETF